MSINYSLHLTGIKLKDNLVLAYWTKVGTDTTTGKSGKFMGTTPFVLEDFAGAMPSVENTLPLVEKFINDNILSTVNEKIQQQLTA